MNFRSRFSKKILLIFLGDVGILYLSLYVSLLLRYGKQAGGMLIEKHLFAFSLIFPVWLVLFGAFEFYNLRFFKNEKAFLYRLLRVMLINAAIAIVMFYLFPLEIEPRRNLLLIAFFATLFIFLWRMMFNLLIVRASVSRVAFFGGNKETADLARYLATHPQLGHRPVAFVSANGSLVSFPSEMAKISLSDTNLHRRMRELRVEIIVIAPELKRDKAIVGFLLKAIPLGISVVEFTSFHEMMTGKIPLSLIQDVWFVENLIGIRRPSYEFAKRWLDIFLALGLGAFAIVTYPVIALAIKLDSRGQIFFRQQRISRHGKIFQLIKYRSMVPDAHKISSYKRSPVPNGIGRSGEDTDHRLTRIGRLLRRSYIDELPQIINILRGEMSFIGPRPERPEFVEQLKQKVPFYETRLLVLPGLTGWAQINMEDDASVEDAPEKMQYDLYYIKNRSFVLDTLIAVRTIFTVLQRSGR